MKAQAEARQYARKGGKAQKFPRHYVDLFGADGHQWWIECHNDIVFPSLSMPKSARREEVVLSVLQDASTSDDHVISSRGRVCDA